METGPNQRGDLRYGTYLRIDELLRLQTPRSPQPHHDEVLFIVVHQAIELWMKLLLHGLDEAGRSLDRDDARGALRLTRRGAEICRCLEAQIAALETMSCLDFLEFRDVLEGASGFQSAQFRELEALLGVRERIPVRLDREGGVAQNPYLSPLSAEERVRVSRRVDEPDLEEKFLAFLDRQVDASGVERVFLVDVAEEAGVPATLGAVLDEISTDSGEAAAGARGYGPSESRRTLGVRDLETAAARSGLAVEVIRGLVRLASRRARLRAVYDRSRHARGDADTYEAWLLAESFVDLTEALALFRSHHVKMVERMIGRRRGTGGSPGVSYLEKTLGYRPFSELWRVRTYL